MWLSQIMRWDFYCTSLWGWQWTQAFVHPPWYHTPSADSWHNKFGDSSLGSSSDALQSGRSRVDLRMTSREWQWLGQPTLTATCQSRRHKGTLAAPAILFCMEEVLIQDRDIHNGRRLCSYVYSIQILVGKSNVRGRGDRVAAASWRCLVWLLKH